MVYNKADQLTTWPGMYTYTYYGDGSLHEVKTGQTTVASYTYHDSGLLEQASYNGRTLANTWDADGNRLRFTATSGTHTFVFDKTAGIPAVIEEVGPSATAYNIREPDGALIARAQGSEIRYYHFDALGSTRLLTDGNGNVTERSEGNSGTTYRTLTFTYDDLGRPDQDSCGGTVLADRTYADDGLLTQVSGPSSVRVTYTYDNAHRLKTEYQSYVNKTVEHQYSPPPTHTETVNIREGEGTGGTIRGTYLYSYPTTSYGGDLRYLTSSQSGPKTEYVYDYSYYGLLSRLKYDSLRAGSPYATYSYDATVQKGLWLSKLTNYRSDDSVISSFSYQYDDVGNRIRVDEASSTGEANGDYVLYEYDKSYRLRKEKRYTGGGSRIYEYDYQYDEIGNRKAKKLVNDQGTNTYQSQYVDNNLLDYVTKGGTQTPAYNRAHLVKRLAYRSFRSYPRRSSGSCSARSTASTWLLPAASVTA